MCAPICKPPARHCVAYWGDSTITSPRRTAKNTISGREALAPPLTPLSFSCEAADTRATRGGASAREGGAWGGPTRRLRPRSVGGNPGAKGVAVVAIDEGERAGGRSPGARAARNCAAAVATGGSPARVVRGDAWERFGERPGRARTTTGGASQFNPKTTVVWASSSTRMVGKMGMGLASGSVRMNCPASGSSGRFMAGG